ncbi:MAG: hypothetical protein NWE98_06935 [Candidatus Bathyarchaeota archaeon]|nr:hypothetical protein [Candidatus Bathyarchaeota archaeon]
MKVTGKLIFYTLGALTALIVTIAISVISKMPLRFLFSIVLGALAFLVFFLTQQDADESANLFNNWNKFGFKLNWDFLVLIAYALSILIVLLVPFASDGQFMSWLSIPMFNYIRLLAGLFLSCILPGYGLLRLIDRKRNYRGLVLLVLSFFVSVFTMAIFSYILIILNVPTVNIYWVTVGFNLLIFIGLLLETLKTRKLTNIQSVSSKCYRLDYLILICVLLFFVVGWLTYYSSYKLGSTGDMWEHYYTFLHVSKGDLLSSSHLSYLHAETWFSLHYLSVFELTGFPSLNGWMVYAFINFFYVLAFYVMVRGIVNDKHPRVPVIAMLIATLFAGFGWIVALSLGSQNSWVTALDTAGSYTYNDIISSFIYGPIPQYFSLSVLFVLIYLMVRQESFSFITGFLTAILVAQGLLVHSPEIIFFVLFFFCFIVCSNRENLGKLKWFSLSLLLGLFLVFLIGLPFLNNFYFSMDLILPYLFVVVCASFILIYFKQRTAISLKISRKIVLFFLCFVWFAYFLSFIVWQSTLSLNVTANLVDVGLKPWYIYPINSGLSLLLGLLGITYIVVNRSLLPNTKFLIISLIALFIAGLALSYININFPASTTYWEKRLYYSFMIIPLSIFGAHFVNNLLAKLRFSTNKLRKPFLNLFVCFLISLIIVSGVGSNVLALDYISIKSQSDPYANFSNAQLQALDFLRANAPAGSTVLGLSTISNRLAYTFSGMNHIRSVYWFTISPSLQFVDIINPELALKMLYSLNITYFFATKCEINALHSNGYVAGHLIKYLPIIFQNSEVIIYQVPKMNPPSSDSNLSLAIPSYMFKALDASSIGDFDTTTFYFPISMLAESGIDYSIKITEDNSIFNSKYIILPSDKNWTAEQITDYLTWVNNGGHLIVLDSDGLGDFARTLSVACNSNVTLYANSIVSSSGTTKINPLSIPFFASSDENIKIISTYNNDNNNSTPLALSKQVGKGEIIYFFIDSLFKALEEDKNASDFTKLGGIFCQLGLQTTDFTDVLFEKRWMYMFYSTIWIRDCISLQGSVKIESPSILPFNQFGVSKLILNGNGTINGLSIKQSTIEGVTIDNFNYKGKVQFMVDSGNISIIPTNYSSYGVLLLKSNFNATIQITEGSSVDLSVAANNQTFSINLESGTLTIENITIANYAIETSDAKFNFSTNVPRFDEILLFMRDATFSVDGNSTFFNAYFPNYIQPVHDSQVQIIGRTHFNFNCSSNNVILLTNLTYSGRFSVPQLTKLSMLYWELTAIPWENLLSSSIIIILFVVFASMIIPTLLRKKVKFPFIDS